jgi:uncharacterized membrane protein
VGDLFSKVVPLGIGAAFTPSLLALQILVVSGDPWRRRSLAVAAGAGSAFGIVGLLSLLGFAQLPTQSGSADGGDMIGGVIRLGAALAMAVVTAFMFWPHPGLQKQVEAGINARVARASLVAFFIMPFLLSIKDVSSFVLLIPALHDIAVSPEDLLGRVTALVVLYALALIGVLAPPAARLMLGERADRPMQAIYRFTMDNQFRIVGMVALVMTAFLIITGIAELRP